MFDEILVLCDEHIVQAGGYSDSDFRRSIIGFERFIRLSGDTDNVTVRFTATVSAPPPVFPMVVQSRIDSQTATASAQIFSRSTGSRFGAGASSTTF